MPDLADGESIEMQGSGKAPYILKNTGGVYSCTCPAWRNQSVAIERRTCKHLRKLRGDAAETERVGSSLPARKPAGEEGDEAAKGPPLLLAHVWENDIDLAGWWMSEKLDGVRAYWNGQQLLSRLGNIFHAPDWFIAGLPQVPLDGELWIERKSFQQTVSIVRRQDKSDHWKQIRYLVFDAPAQTDPFEERLAFVAGALAAAKLKHVKPHAHERCRSLEHLQAELQRVESLGGEGLMLRQPGSKYEAGRSTTLLKVKNFHDAEAIVIDHVAGKGRHKGRLGALVVRLPDGTEFSVGTGFSDKQRELPPSIGSTITFRYQELSTGGVPRFPSFVRVRKDSQPRSPSTPRSDTDRPDLESDTQVINVPVSHVQRKAPGEPGVSAPGSVSTSGPGPVSTRYFEFVSGNSSKFWEITLDGRDVTVRFGRIGTNGQSQTKSFPDESRATTHAEKLIAEKTEKGYVEKPGP